jgi:hypothetical protein
MNLINNYLNLTPYTKVGVGIAVAGIAILGLEISNPVSALALVIAGQGLAWLPDLVTLCLQSIRNPNQIINLAPQRIDPRKYNGVQSEEEAYRMAILASNDDARKATGFKCVIQMMLEGIPPDDKKAIAALPDIPRNFLLEIEKGKYYHAGSLVLTLLAQTGPKDPIIQRLIPDPVLKALAGLMDIPVDEFNNIWVLAEMDPDSEHVDPETQAGLKTDYRLGLLNAMLNEKQTEKTKTFLRFLREQDVWKQRFP